jgi:hypothetical protein
MHVWVQGDDGDVHAHEIDEEPERCIECGMECTGLDLRCSMCWQPMCDGCHEGFCGVCTAH